MDLVIINETEEVSLNVTDWYFENETSTAYTEWTLTLQEWRYIFQRILVPIVLLVGVIGNSITIVVLTRRNMQSSTNFYLTALAVSDLLYLVFVFSLSLEHIHGMDHKSMWLYWQYFRFALWFTDASNSTSTWLTVVFTVERYIAVCHPMKRKIFCTQTRAKRIIGAVYMVCFASTVTTPFEWVVAVNPKTNNTTLKLDYSVLGANDTYKKTFYWFTAVIFILIPLVFLTVFNSFLIVAVKQSQIQRNQLTQRNKLGPPSRTISHQSADGGEAPSTPFLHNEKGGQESRIAKKNSLGFQIEKKNSTGHKGSLQSLPPRSLRGVRDFHSSQENKITRMLIAVVILALLCQSPTAIMLIYTSFTEVPYGTTSFYVTRILGNIFNFLTTVNAACNFILYCAMSDRFRKTFLQTFCGKWFAQRSFRYPEISETGAMEVSSLQQHFKRSTSSVLRMGSSKSPKNLKLSITNETLANDWPKSAENSNGGLNFQDLDANELSKE